LIKYTTNKKAEHLKIKVQKPEIHFRKQCSKNSKKTKENLGVG